MARKLASVSLSTGRAGINRFEGETKPNQFSEALNVINDDGDVRRRDAFVSVATVAPHHRPVGGGLAYIGRLVVDTVVYYPVVDDAGFEEEPITGAAITCRSFLVGHTRRQFDGIELGDVEGTTHPLEVAETELGTLFPAGAAPRRIRTYYWNGTAWTEMWHMDQTWVNVDGDRVSLLRGGGRVCWHTPLFADSWVTSEQGPDDVEAYWIRIDLVDEEGAAADMPAAAADVALRQPGMTLLDLEPARTLLPVTMGTGKLLLIGSDRSPPFVREHGAVLGVWRGRIGEPTDHVLIERHFGAGVYGEQTWPQWDANGTPVGAPGLTRGNTGFFTDDDDGVGYTDRRYYWPYVYQGLIASGGTAGFPQITQATFPPGAGERNSFRHWLLVVTATGGGSGLTPGQYHQIVDTLDQFQLGDPSLAVWPPLAAAPVAGDTFSLQAPGLRIELCPHRRNYFPILTSNNSVAVGGTVPEWEWSPDNGLPALDGVACHARVLEEPRWRIPAGRRWTAMFDAGKKQVYLTNGRSGLMRFDGRYLLPAIADTTSALAQRLAAVPNDQVDTTAAQGHAAGQLETRPPSGAFVLDYMGRTVVLRLEHDPQLAGWSSTYARDIWQLGRQARIADGSNLPIEGGATLYDLLVVWTRESIHVSSPPDETGYFRFRPAGTSGGFASHEGVVRVPIKGRSILVGPGADTIRLFDGSATEDVLDEYERVIPGGVNVKRLVDSVGVCWPQRTLALWAVASAGAAKNDTILVWNYETGAWWRWSYPLGVSSMALWTGSDGRERLLIGTDDGFIAVMTNADTEDGQTIEGSVRSPPARVLKQEEASFVSLHLDVQEMGQGSVTVRSYVDGRDAPAQDGEMPVDGGSATFDEAVFADEDAPAATDAVFADQHQRGVRVNMRAGTVGHSFQYELAGTSRWRLRAVDLEVRGRSSRGRK